MNNRNFPLNYIWYIFPSFMWLMAFFLIKETSTELFESLVFSRDSIPKTWAIILLLDILFLSGALIPTWSVIKEHLTIYDDLGLKRPGLLRAINLRWEDITHVERRAYSLHINSNSGWITINLAIYRDPEQIAKHINDCIRSHSNSILV